MFDAFDLSCCSYVHKKFKKEKKIQEKSFKKRKKKIFGLGALGLQVISIHFQKEISRLGVLAFLVNFF